MDDFPILTTDILSLQPEGVPPHPHTVVAEQPVTRKKKYLAGLDTLRALAAITVCLFHYTGGMLSKLVVPEAKHFFSKGYLGVEVFFVISGFIIPYSLTNKNHRIANFFPYIKNRVLRINPPAYISLLLILSEWAFIDLFITHNLRHISTLSWG